MLLRTAVTRIAPVCTRRSLPFFAPVLLAFSLAACATQEVAEPTPAAPADTTPAAPVEVVAPAVAPEPTVPPADFTSCIPHLQQRARNSGISSATVDQVLGQVQYAPRVIELDRKQPEFSETFQHYLSLRVTDQRIEQGRKLLGKHSALLQRLEQEYGVPPHYLLAFWGLETNYGSFLGKMPVLDSLATLACDPRRSEYFTLELLDALK
ncbi:MAG TPA: lytic murein transglycosylase, partial [Dongiaceae bacterium]|nr:lytic murein transglycosylase [Dongiaceae bacterium]